MRFNTGAATCAPSTATNSATAPTITSFIWLGPLEEAAAPSALPSGLPLALALPFPSGASVFASFSASAIAELLQKLNSPLSFQVPCQAPAPSYSAVEQGVRRHRRRGEAPENW